MPATDPRALPADGAPLVHVHWTSGWDSTFRVLNLLHGTNAVVQPWYVVDPIRPSAPLEVKKMDEIRERLAARRPDLAARLRPTMLYPRADIPEMPEISKLWAMIRERARFGAQYDWLSRMARHEGLTRVEMGLHDPNVFFNAAIIANGEWIETPYGPTLVLIDQPADPAIELFRPFAFGMMGMSKLDMGEAAGEKGFADLLELSWFCAEPARGGRACGLCNPCQQVIAADLSRRMPLTRRILGHAHASVLRARRALKRRNRKR